MQSWQIRKPQRQIQQKEDCFEQQWQIFGPLCRRLDGRFGRIVRSFIGKRSEPPAKVVGLLVRPSGDAPEIRLRNYP
jgi:hypothetical protein